MPTFGLISEGITDQIIIENILFGIFGEDYVATFLEPLRDASDEDKMTISGNWTKVIDYLMKADKIESALVFSDFIIIHIDTDVSAEFGIQHNSSKENRSLTPTELIAYAKANLISRIAPALYKRISSKIIFAIAVHSTECWLLPLWETQKAKQAQIANCLDRINNAIQPKLKFTIGKKEVAYYRKLSDPFAKAKVLKEKYKLNPSLRVFVEELVSIAKTPS